MLLPGPCSANSGTILWQAGSQTHDGMFCLSAAARLQESDLYRENEANMDRLVAEGKKSSEPLK